MIKTYFISERFFTNDEIKSFKNLFRFDLKDIEYSSQIEIDFNNLEEKEFLLQKGYPKILARFFAS